MPKPVYPKYRLFNKDCLEAVAELEPKSIDTVITDPPYGLNFMGKEWDHGVPGMLFWARIRKVCKPGALLLAFGGTRTYHRLACAIEDGGWQIRDCMMWLYGSGFPKSHDLGKATEDPEQWQGYGSALKPAWEPILIAMKPFRGTFVDNALAYAVAGFNIDAGRIGTEATQINTYAGRGPFGDSQVGNEYVSKVTSGRWPANLILSHHPECVQVGTKRVKGTKGGADYTPTNKQGSVPITRNVKTGAHFADADGLETVEAWECVEDCPVKMLDLQSIVGGMHGAGNARKGSSQRRKTKAIHRTSYVVEADLETMHRFGDTGGASRFFYTAKASRAERDEGLEDLDLKSGSSITGRKPGSAGGQASAYAGTTEALRRNLHPTVKPLAIMEYLCRLTRPPSGGVVFDPFMGSGTTGVACAKTGRKFIGCEIDEEHGYFEIARRRIKKAYMLKKRS